MLEYASRNAELILKTLSRDFSERYFNNPESTGLIMAIGSHDAYTNGFPVAPSTVSIFAIRHVFSAEIPPILNTTPALPPETSLAINCAFDAGMTALDQLALMKFCEYQTDPEEMVKQMVNRRIFEKSIEEQILPHCRPLFSKLKVAADEELIDLAEMTWQTDKNCGHLSPDEISGIETMGRLYRQTYPYAKSFREAETRRIFGL
jgi:hypothetical protein